MKLHYIPDEDPATSERWLPGIPASDFETDDEHEIAVCLASGLYAEEKPAHAHPVPVTEKPARTSAELPAKEAD